MMVEFGFKDTDQELKKIINSISVRGDENIYYSEFLTATLDKKIYLNSEKLWMAFKHFDVDNTNYITLENLREAFARTGKKYEDNELENLMRNFGM